MCSCVALLLLAGQCPAETIRVTSWNLEPGGADTNAASITDAAVTLRQIAPDVILLQGVHDWQACADLIAALRPTYYNVLICSSFRDARTGMPSPSQAAVLAKGRAYFTWSEGWRDSNSIGGFAFAGMRWSNQRLGFYSIQLPGLPLAGGKRDVAGATVGQWFDQYQAIHRWLTNQPDYFVLAASLVTTLSPDKFLHAFEQAGLSYVAPVTGPNPESAAGLLLASAPGLAQHSQVTLVAFPGHSPLTAEIELDPARIAAVHAAPAASGVGTNAGLSVAAVGEHAFATTQPPLKVRSLPAWLAALLGAALAAVFFWALAWRRLRRTTTAAPMLSTAGEGEAPSSFTVVMAPHSATGQEVTPAAPHPVVHLETPGPTQTHSAAWQQRALAAEQRAAHATALLNRKLLPELSHWLKQKLVRRLLTDRAALMRTQEEATHKAANVEARLARIETQLQQQNQIYERRLEDLTRELHAAKEENRAIIRARINQVKAEMAAARARLLAESKESAGTGENDRS